MASRIFTRGKQLSAERTSGISTAGLSDQPVQTMSVDDSTIAFADADLRLNQGGAVANELDVALDAGSPSRSAQTVTYVATFPAGSAFDGQRVKRVALHNATPANVTTASDTLFAGVDGLDLLKGNFPLRLTLTVVWS